MSAFNPGSIPLGLYIHFPWCVAKCPYCDFNSHALGDALAETAYVDALLKDLDDEAELAFGRPIDTVFMGGGTPSLFSPAAIGRVLDAVDRRIGLRADAEITLEANPGTVEQQRFEGYRAAGVNRLSIGVQSFEAAKLQRLGRIHGRDEALRAADAARNAGFERLNLDLMFGLPEQTVEQAVADIDTALSLSPSHISHYQLTLEPNTVFYRQPPALPADETIEDMLDACQERLSKAGFEQYEVSAYSRQDPCRHNLNYWRFGDYLAIGAGGHGKTTVPNGDIQRYAKRRVPASFMEHAGAPDNRVQQRGLGDDEKVFEFALNAFRLREGFDLSLFTARTGLSAEAIAKELAEAVARGWCRLDGDRVVTTTLGWRYLNDTIGLFLR